MSDIFETLVVAVVVVAIVAILNVGCKEMGHHTQILKCENKAHSASQAAECMEAKHA